MRTTRFRSAFVLLVVATLILTCGVAAAQSKIQGVINGRSGNTMSVQTANGNVTVVLNAGTLVQETQGVFHARRKDLAVTALVPGLSVEVQGSFNGQNQLVADTVKFSGSSLKTATDIQAGVTPVQEQEQQQQQQLAQQQAQLQTQEQVLKQQQEEQAADAAKIAANKAAIEAVNKRFGELGDYNIWAEVTVYFGNDRVIIDPQYKPKLLALAQKAKTVTGYVVQVQGYASKIGSAALNQKLSQERATNVIEFLEQQGGIPLTNMLAPGAMGTADQVAPDKTVEGQAENRRVVVRVLQNKGIAGT